MRIQNLHLQHKSVRPKNEYPFCVRCRKKREDDSGYWCLCQKCGRIWTKKLHAIEKKLKTDCLLSTHPELWNKLDKNFKKELSCEKVEFT